MKKITPVILMLLSIFVPSLLFAQSETPKAVDNYTVQYLMVFNHKKELLMMKNKLGWHTPAIRSNKPQSIKESMDSLAASIGIRIEGLKLAGLYVHKFEGLKDHPEVSFRSHYTAKLADKQSNSKSGAKIQGTTAEVEYHWVPQEQALSRFHFDFLRQQTEAILKGPAQVWGGTFLITWKDDQLQGSRIIEPIHRL